MASRSGVSFGPRGFGVVGLRVEKGELEGEGTWRETDIRAVEKFWRILVVSRPLLSNLGEEGIWAAQVRGKN